MNDLCALTAVELRRGFLAKEFSPVEAFDAMAARIEATAGFNALIAIDLDSGREQARRATEIYAHGEADTAPLLGIPVTVKDLLDVEGMRTTCGSPLLAEDRPARRDAAAVAKVRAAGAIVCGKTNLFEFAWGIGSVNRTFGDCPNPWAPDREAGGSSTGAAVGLALGQAPLAIGTDTAGSIRIPSAYCGVTGIRPTTGRIDDRGCFPLAPTFDQIGPMARSAADLALLLEALDPSRGPSSFAREAERLRREGLRNLRIAYWTGPPGSEVHPDVSAAGEGAAGRLAELGAKIEPLEDLGVAGDALEIFITAQAAEVLEAHRRRGLYPEQAAGYLPSIAERLRDASAITLSDYLAASTRRRRYASRFRELFASFDLLLCPVSPIPPPALGTGNDLRSRVIEFTVPQVLAGIPAVAIPAGFDSDGAPIGMQLSAPVGADDLLLAVAAGYEAATGPIRPAESERRSRAESDRGR